MADQPRSGSHDAGLAFMIFAVIFAGLGWLIWHYFQYQIRSGVRWIRVEEMWLISWFVGRHYTVQWHGYAINYHDLMTTMRGMPPPQITDDMMSALSAVALYPLHIPFALVLGGMGLWSILYGPGTQFRRKLNLDGLIRVQAKTFPVISPFVKFNPGTQPPRPPGAPVPAELPLFAEALAPEEWIAYHQIPAPDGHINEQATFIAFAQQLGPRWQGPQKLAPHKQVLLAACCLKAARKRREGDAMLGRLAHCWSFEKGLQLTHELKAEAQKILRDKKIAGPVLQKCNQHGFETTVMLRGLQTAREEGGVLAPAQFVWLRAHDRNLWYPMNNLGRQSFHIEAMGAMAHFKAEKLTKRPIPRPKVQTAVKSIAELTSSARARPIPPLDYSQSKKTKALKKPAAAKKTAAKKPAKKAVKTVKKSK